MGEGAGAKLFWKKCSWSIFFTASIRKKKKEKERYRSRLSENIISVAVHRGSIQF